MALRPVTETQIVIGGVLRTILVDEELERAMRRLKNAFRSDEDCWRAATLDVAIRKTMREPT